MISTWLELIAGGLIVGGLYAVIAIGLNLQYGLTRIMNISHGEFLMLGAYATWFAHTTFGWNPLVALPLVSASMFFLGLALYMLCFRKIVREAPVAEVIEARSLLIGFGLMYLVQNVVLMIWGADLRGYTFMDDAAQIGGVRLGANRLLVFAAAVAASLILILGLRFTLLGKSVRAMMQSSVGAQLVGIDTRYLHPIVFGVGLAMSGVAGSLLSMMYELSPSMGGPYTVTALIVITLGGLGSSTGCLVAGLLLGLVEALGMHFMSPSLKMLLSYAVFVGVLLARPQGLFSR